MNTLRSAGLLSVLFVTVLVAGCQKPEGKRYPLKTCVVCDQSLTMEGGPITFIHDGYEVRVCSEEDRAKFQQAPGKYMTKIKEVKYL